VMIRWPQWRRGGKNSGTCASTSRPRAFGVPGDSAATAQRPARDQENVCARAIPSVRGAVAKTSGGSRPAMPRPATIGVACHSRSCASIRRFARSQSPRRTAAGSLAPVAPWRQESGTCARVVSTRGPFGSARRSAATAPRRQRIRTFARGAIPERSRAVRKTRMVRSAMHVSDDRRGSQVARWRALRSGASRDHVATTTATTTALRRHRHRHATTRSAITGQSATKETATTDALRSQRHRPPRGSAITEL